MRLKALKKIEKILSHRRKIDATKRAISRNNIWRISRTLPKASNSAKRDDKNSNSSEAIYRYLSKHYILRRSIVFILDGTFSSVFFYERALDLIKNVFNKLNSNDYFGFL
jgi:hypothetical protein